MVAVLNRFGDTAPWVPCSASGISVLEKQWPKGKGKRDSGAARGFVRLPCMEELQADGTSVIKGHAGHDWEFWGNSPALAGRWGRCHLSGTWVSEMNGIFHSVQMAVKIS